MARIHLVIGPVGSGKSTFATALARKHAALRLTLDDWMTRLFRPDRPVDDVMAWYVERARRCVEQIWEVTRGALEAGTDVVLEIGLIQRRDRESFYARVDREARELEVYLVDAPREVRRERVRRRNAERGSTFSMDVPPDVFELASDLWEPPDDTERDDRRVQIVPLAGPFRGST